MIKLSLLLGLVYGFVSSTTFATANRSFNDSETDRLINGTEVTDGSFPEVVWIKSGASTCTGTVVGPRVLLTASHCAGDGATATFSIKGTNYSVKITRSPLYMTGKDHDVALGLSTTDINVPPANITGTPQVGSELTLMGYGCTTPTGNGQAIGGEDGILRKGTTVVTRFAGYDMVSSKAGGAATCYGDSGGPAFGISGQQKNLLGVISKGNIKDTTYSARLDSTESQEFLKDFAQKNNVEICGVNKNCSQGPGPTAPTCQLSANPSSVSLGQSLSLQLSVTGNATSASINGTSVSVTGGQISLTPSSVGTFTASASVSGPGGSNSCSASYTVTGGTTPPAPTCQLSATPPTVTLGQAVTLNLSTFGTATSASINGISVSHPNGQLTITPSSEGTFTAAASVSGPGGSNSCTASYSVVGGTTPDPPNCTLTATPSAVTLGQSIVLRLQSMGEVTSALIDGVNVGIPVGQTTITPTEVGQHQSSGLVEGPGGRGTCRITYSVEDNTPQPIPDLTVVPSYCGSNDEGHPDISQVCLAVLKSVSANGRSQYVRDAVLITYTNSAKEVLPIIHRKAGTPAGAEILEEVTAYANLAVREGDYMVLDTRKVIVTKRLTGGPEGSIPTRMEGRSATGKYFRIDKMTAH
ncbi:MAG: trypsin-like serine protease [Bdellovibrionaceae bacterium]|nr:trypsin-like serine protease [Bdellovibrionales bacterium]MCB9254783.1 trypsin-like serine protease [Pseudobdellovibrionaceae bacterium]